MAKTPQPSYRVIKRSGPFEIRVYEPMILAEVTMTYRAQAFFGGVHQELIGALQTYHRVAEAFRDGGGVAPADLHEDVHRGTARFTAAW